MTKLTKVQARNEVIKAGLTIHFDTGSCGDKPYGSRLYFKAPDAELNEYRQPINKNATISNLGGSSGWVISWFGVEGKDNKF